MQPRRRAAVLVLVPVLVPVLVLVLALVPTVLAAACAATARPVPEPFDDTAQAMQADVEPLAEGLLPKELTKDAGAVDYAAIQAAAGRARAIFEQMQDPGRRLYEQDAKMRGFAQTAAAWFGEIGAAAAARQHVDLVRLYLHKNQICANCHD